MAWHEFRSGPDPAAVRATIQEAVGRVTAIGSQSHGKSRASKLSSTSETRKVTKKMVGSGNDIEADMPLMDIGMGLQYTLRCDV